MLLFAIVLSIICCVFLCNSYDLERTSDSLGESPRLLKQTEPNSYPVLRPATDEGSNLSSPFPVLQLNFFSTSTLSRAPCHGIEESQYSTWENQYVLQPRPLSPSSADTLLQQAQDLNGVSDGSFRRPESAFRNTISSEAGAQYPPEKDRYALYVNYGCPWVRLIPSSSRLRPVYFDSNTTAS